MNTESNASTSQKSNNVELIFNDNFINYINILSDSIKEFYKVSKNVSKNKNVLIVFAQKEVNDLDFILNNITQTNPIYNDNNSFNIILEKLREIFKKMQLNINSEEKNLNFFFEDAKILFKKMKDKRQELIIKIKIKNRALSSSKNNRAGAASHNNIDIRFRKLKNNDIENYNHSEANCNIKNIDRLDFKNINMTVRHRGVMNYKKRKSRTLNKTKELINDEYYEDKEKNKRSAANLKNITLPTTKIIDAKSQNVEIEKLKMINKKLSNELKKCKNKTLESNNNNNILENSIKNEMNNINIVIQDKDKIISTLQKNLNNNNQINNELLNALNNYKLELKKLKEENNQLKQNIQVNKILENKNQEIDKNISQKINNLVKENSRLKNIIEELKIKTYNSKSEYNSNLNMLKDNFDKNNNQIPLEREIELLKLKLNSTENKNQLW